MGQKTEHHQVALIVEDDTETKSLAATLLEETDLHVVEVSSGEEALHYLHHHAGEVVFIFSEVKLPCLMDGLDLARLVRLKWPWIRTVLTSDAPPADDLDKALSQVRFMPKPWLPLEVLVEAEKAVQATHSEQTMPRRQTGALATARM
ncbi:response regulator [Microvirga tunisiensis]|uniref:Response regulator n=1 Tax=Microvirga tunisiensis TaxID=2108360 RepID=A0A5N7MS49_9HYPH|nr:response regulator [Microvirga tunisiensis]MPR11772.1 response regulator [Microvirga tunisiensis]MPR29783.1 response regulator [Microvirga tunisiensis]